MLTEAEVDRVGETIMAVPGSPDGTRRHRKFRRPAWAASGARWPKRVLPAVQAATTVMVKLAVVVTTCLVLTDLPPTTATVTYFSVALRLNV